MVKKILVPVDGSESSGKALSFAADIAEKYKAKLSVLFVAPHKVDDGLRHFATHEYNLKDEGAITTISEKIGKSTINRMVNKLKSNILINPVVLFGDPASRIVEYSTACDFDMIVMGSRGLGSIKGIMMGSVSHKVSRKVECTFVSVK